ncbi:hypothetical protein ACIBH1_08825 [Nonomuraea sp. NPDC050663]|uniref:hypothetical protein n=1 Tax=Nonomuraea sp. NPDC050663 TaxID=3364370 RepID=UPI0037964F85
MPASVDLTSWPLIRAVQGGRLTVEEADSLAAGLSEVLDRARAEDTRFAIVVDQRDRQAPQKGALEGIHAFWAEHAEEIARWCCGYASAVATQELADLVVNPGPGGLVVFGSVDYEEALSWAKSRLE